MGFDPITMGAMAVAGAGLKAYGAIQEGQAASDASNYNAAAAGFNAEQSRRNAELTSEAGAAKAAMVGRDTRAAFGSERARAAGSGLNPNTGSAADVQASTAELGHLDAMTIRSNATREAYGHQIEGLNYDNKATMDRWEGKQAKSASYIKAASSLLGSASDATMKYQEYKMAGGFGSSSGSSHPNTDYGMDEL